ncbi:hypothetical protein [Streptomyces sp. NBC_00829]|nr:hypothetical protein OG293_07980 [Streptomyces sp. NBC_00829]
MSGTRADEGAAGTARGDGRAATPFRAPARSATGGIVLWAPCPRLVQD